MRGIISRGGIIAGEVVFMLGLDPQTLISRIFVLLTAFAVHEFAHLIRELVVALQPGVALVGGLPGMNGG